ncbi:MAG: hypothetical protein KC413_11905 [Anaerolineales bacterium]|nr:hypothetical protein [Anaerolineales bacterium]
MIQTGQFWQNGSWVQGIWLNEAPSPQRDGCIWLRPHYFWLDGELISVDAWPEQFVPAGDLPGWWAGLRSYATDRGTAVFRLRDYAARFVQANPGLITGQSDAAACLYQAISQTVQANGYAESYIRPVPVYATPQGEAQPGKPRLGIVSARWQPSLPEVERQQGIVAVSRAQGANMTLLPEGYTAVYTAAHLLVVQDGMVCVLSQGETPASLARDTLLTLAHDAGFPVMERPIAWDDVQVADEVLVASAAVGVVAVRELDGQVVGNGRTGPITRHLQQLYQNTVYGKNRYARQWLDYMILESTI